MQRTAPILLAAILASILFAGFGGSTYAQDAIDAGPGTIPPGFSSVNVAHFAPFAADPFGTSVTVNINGLDFYTDVVYGDVFPNVQLPTGVYTVEVRPTGSMSVAISGVFTLQSQIDYSILAVGDGSAQQPLSLVTISNTVPPPSLGKAKVLVGHYAPFVPVVTQTAIDLCDDVNHVAVAGPIFYGIHSGYQEFDAGIYDLSIALSGSNCAQTVYDLPPLQFNPGERYDAFAIGKRSEAYPIRVVSLTGLDYPAIATMGHFAPFGNTIAETAVDVRVNGKLALTDVVYGEYFPEVVVPSGPVLVELLSPAGNVSPTIALTKTIVFDQMGKYDLFAVGGANGWDLDLTTAEISKTAPAGFALATIGHLAPFAPVPAQTAVDICLENGVILYADVRFPKVVANIVLPPAVYDLRVARHGTSCETLVIDVPPFRLEAGDNRDVFVIGAPLELFIPTRQGAQPGAGPDFLLQVVSTTGLRSPFPLYLPLILDSEVLSQ